MGKPIGPCKYCGGPKPPGRGRKACDACREARKPMLERAHARRRQAKANALKDGAGIRRPRFKHEAPPGQKWCPRCQQYLPFDEFKDQPSKKGGKAAYCAPCQTNFFHEYQIGKAHGITGDEYYRLLDLQGGRCAICLSKPRTRRLAVDHDHVSGQIRGLLCTRCNHKVLGAAREDPSVLRRAAAYLERPPTSPGWTPEDLGDWDTMRVEAAAEEAESIAAERGSKLWAAIIQRDEDGDPGEGYVITTLANFAALLADCEWDGRDGEAAS